MRFTTLPIILLILTDALAETEAPGGLYRWEDADGHVQFSDRPPTGPVSHVEVQPRPQQGPAKQADGDDYYSIENQARRLEEERKGRDREREEADRKRLEEQERRAKIEEARAEAEHRAEEDRRDCCPVYLLPPPFYGPGPFYQIPPPPFYGPARPERPPERPAPSRPDRPAPSPESHIRGGLLR